MFDRNASFPPQDQRRIYEIYEILSAWYSADPNQLLDTFLNRGAIDSVKGRIWSEQKKEEMSTLVHVPLTSDIASVSADIMFSDGVQSEVTDNVKTDERLEEIKDLNGMTNRMIEAAETASALGGVVLKPTWETEHFDFPIMTIAQPDNVFIDFKYGFPIGFTFHKVIENDNGTVWRLIERHEKGKIYNFLYKGRSDNFGTRLPLNRHPHTENLQDEINLLSINSAFNVLLPSYVPNKRPNKQMRGSALGYADIQGLESLLASVDSTMSSWIRDIELGRGRIIVPEHYLDFVDGEASFNANREMFMQMNMDPNKENPLTISQFAIRMEEHKQTVQELCSMVVNMAGYSPQSFGFNLDGGISTQSHEVRERKTLATKQKKERYFKPALESSLHKMLMIDKYVLGKGTNADVAPVVNFSDTLTQDLHQTAQTLDLLNRAEAMSKDAMVRALHPDWNEEQIQAEVNAIMKEKGMLVDSPITIGGKEYE